MRLGVVMMGTGAHAAACVGVMKELENRGIWPHAVCAMGMGAWPAALFAAGLGGKEMESALRQAAGMGRRMMARTAGERIRKRAMPEGIRLNHLLSLQTGGRVLPLCAGAALFPCRMVGNGQRVLFSTRPFSQEPGMILAMQASVGFAARACMALPPFLAPVQYMGSALLGETDVAFCMQQLMRMGAQRVLVIAPQTAVRHQPDAMELIGAMLRLSGEAPPDAQAGVLRMAMPEGCGALDFERMEACCEAGRAAAERELDDVFDRMGMAFCRVLPFRRQIL